MFLGFTLAMFVLAITPGPGVFAAISEALSGGFRSSLRVIAGIVVGDLAFLMLAILGMAAVANVLGEFFNVVKLIGGAYLVWLGIRMWKSQPKSYETALKAEDQNGWQRFFAGLLITLGNPKVILFYAGFLPAFVDLTQLSPLDVVLVGCIVVSVLTATMATYSFFVARARGLLKSERALRRINRTAGSIMIATGTAILVRE